MLVLKSAATSATYDMLNGTYVLRASPNFGGERGELPPAWQHSQPLDLKFCELWYFTHNHTKAFTNSNIHIKLSNIGGNMSRVPHGGSIQPSQKRQCNPPCSVALPTINLKLANSTQKRHEFSTITFMRFQTDSNWAHGISSGESSFIISKLPISLSKASGNSLNPAQALPIKVKSMLQSKDETPPLILLYRGVLQS